MTESIILDCNCVLGEGLFVSEQLVAWVDIVRNEVFTYCDSELRSHVLPVEATVILDRNGDVLLMGSDAGLGKFDLVSREYSSLWDYGPMFGSATHRTNDGCHLRRGGYLIGTMHRETPLSTCGALYHIDSEGGINELDDAVYIPNSFVELDDESVLVSDSNLGVVYRYCFSGSLEVESKTTWYTAEKGVGPDGGCRLPDGSIAIAMWDAACIRVFDEAGNVLRDIPVGAKRPTNCKYDSHSQMLWVTSALEGLNTEELQDYPQSGKTFAINMSTYPA